MLGPGGDNMNRYLLMMALPLLSGAALATDYTVDFSRVEDLEAIRPLVEGCTDFDAMELYRDKMESIANLEDMRPTLSAIGLGMFNDCPAGIAATGISAIKQPVAATAPGYSVDFTRVDDFETLRPLVTECKDFGALEHFRPKMEAAVNLNDIAKTLKNLGYGVFDKCPAGVTGAGITAVE
jgi:hypothetical protein